MKKRCPYLLCALFFLMGFVPDVFASVSKVISKSPKNSPESLLQEGGRLNGEVKVIDNSYGVDGKIHVPVPAEAIRPKTPPKSSATAYGASLTGDAMRRRAFQPPSLAKPKTLPTPPTLALAQQSPVRSRHSSSPTSDFFQELGDLHGISPGPGFGLRSPSQFPRAKTPFPRRSSSDMSISSSSPRTSSETQSSSSPPASRLSDPLESLDPLDQQFAEIPTRHLIDHFQRFRINQSQIEIFSFPVKLS